MKKLLLAALFVLAGCASASAWLPHGTPSAPTTCPHSGAGYADGCAGANQSALMLNTGYFTNGRQTGQSQYKALGGTPSNHPPPWDLAGVDYPVGHYTPDVSLLDPTTSPPAGCSYNAGLRTLDCPAGTTIAHYRFNGLGIRNSTTGAPITIDDIHQTMTADNCRFFAGSSHVTFSTTLILTNSTFDFNDECKMTAALYKKAGDPGFITQSTGTANISGTSLTYTGTPTGNLRLFQYIDFPGVTTAPVQITAGSGLGPYTLSVSQSTVGPVTVTSGPVQNIQNGATFSSGALTAKYNWFDGWGQAFNPGQAVGDTEIAYNYSNLYVTANQHVNFMVKIPGPGTMNFYKQNFNTLLWDSHSYIVNGGSTGSLTLFATLDEDGAGITTTTLMQTQHNTIIGNEALNPAGTDIGNTAMRFLSQGVPNDAGIAATLSGGVLNVSAFYNGNPLAIGKYIACLSCTRTTKITSLGTGSGGAGTYNVDNSADTATITSPLDSVSVTNGGSGYTTASVGFTGGGGSGAAGVAVISGGVITGITRTSAGGNYTSRPTVTITGDGTGATALANLQDVYTTPGIITTLDWQENYVDNTGFNGGFFNATDRKNVEVSTTTIQNNVEMKAGAVCVYNTATGTGTSC